MVLDKVAELRACQMVGKGLPSCFTFSRQKLDIFAAQGVYGRNRPTEGYAVFNYPSDLAIVGGSLTVSLSL